MILPPLHKKKAQKFQSAEGWITIENTVIPNYFNGVRDVPHKFMTFKIFLKNEQMLLSFMGGPLTPLKYIRDSKIILIMFDLTDRVSFDEIIRFRNHIQTVSLKTQNLQNFNIEIKKKFKAFLIRVLILSNIFAYFVTNKKM